MRLYLEEGFTASEVAEALGGGLSRGAVIGKIRRLGLSKRERNAEPSASRAARVRCERGPRIERRLPPQRPPQPLPPLREIGPTGSPATLALLGLGQCRWPLDDPGPGRMQHALFCAGPARRGPYCPAHAALAGRPAAAR